MESKQGEILALKDNLQRAKTALLGHQNRSREKFEEQQKEMESYKTKMDAYKDETVSLKRQIQEMRVAFGSGLLDLTNSIRRLHF